MTEPQNIHAEDSVLGALMLSGTATERVLPLLEPDHFFKASNGVVFDAIRRLSQRGKTADPLVLVSELEESGRLKEAGGEIRIHELAKLVPSTLNAPHYAGLVRESWEKRETLKALAASLSVASNGKSVAEAIEIAERNLIELRSRLEKGRESVISTQKAAMAYEEKLLSPPSETAGVSVPFSFLRRLQPSRLYVLGGYQADGKTAVSVQFLKSACKDGARVGFVSVEMSWQDLTDRLIACYGIPYREVISGRIEPANQPVVTRALGELKSWNCDLIDDEGANASSLRRYQKLGHYDLLIVDHLHRFDWQDRRDLERIVRTITNIAREAEIPVILLAQLHRRQDEFPRPTMASLRESGMIEAEAAAVWFVWRERDEHKLPTDEAEFIVAKNRFGPTGTHPLHFRADEVRFVEVRQ